MNEDFNYIITTYKPKFWPYTGATWPELVNLIAQQKIIETIINRIATNQAKSNYAQDIVQDIYLQLMTRTPEQAIKHKEMFLKEQLSSFLVNIVSTSLKSNKNQTFTRYRRETSKKFNSISEPDNLRQFINSTFEQEVETYQYPTRDLLELAISGFTADWYLKELASRMYLRGIPITTTQIQTRILARTLRENYRQIRLKLNQWFVKNCEDAYYIPPLRRYKTKKNRKDDNE